MFKQSRSLHGALVPFAALPLILTAITGVAFSILDRQGVQADWLLEIYSGHFGPIILQPYYAYLLGLCVLILVGTGSILWWHRHRPRHHKA
ncbi:MAG: hypothetical protein ACKO0M_12535 [Cyanobium sp.]